MIPASFYRFTFKRGETLEVKKDGYLKGAQDRFFDLARKEGVRVIAPR